MIDTHETAAATTDRGPRGKAIGFIDSYATASRMAEILEATGIPREQIVLISGEAGESLWDELMGRALWGEQAEMVFHQGAAVLKDGQVIFTVDVPDHNSAERVANIAVSHGGRNVTYFGDFVDTQLTA